MKIAQNLNADLLIQFWVIDFMGASFIVIAR